MSRSYDEYVHFGNANKIKSHILSQTIILLLMIVSIVGCDSSSAPPSNDTLNILIDELIIELEDEYNLRLCGRGGATTIDHKKKEIALRFQVVGDFDINELRKMMVVSTNRLINKVNAHEELKEKSIFTKLNDKIKTGDIVICNADFPYAMEELIDDEEFKGKYNNKKISDMEYSCSTFIIYLGLKKKYPNLLVHNLYLGDNFKENIEDAFKGKIPKNPPMYIYCPSSIDGSMAPKNKECLNIMVRVPNLISNKINWNEDTINLLRKRIFSKLIKIKGLEDIEENIIYESYLTPEDFLNSFNSYGGTAFGFSHTLTQTNYFRPHIKSPTVKNLYFVGSSVHPGTGVSMVLLSSKLVAEEILKL